MRRAVLLFNPNAGRQPAARQAIVERIATALRAQSLEVELISTQGHGTAGGQAAAAADSGVDLIFACGGDGTVHEILQGIAFHPHVTLGIIPLGSANALARHLRLSLDPVQAALQQLAYEARSLSVGKVTYQSASGEAWRYFLVMAGAGPDGALVYNMLTHGKHRIGRAAYYLQAALLFCRQNFSSFEVTSTLNSGDTRRQRAASAMAVRVSDLGGLFSPLVRGADIDHGYILLNVAKVPARLSLPAWFAMGWLRLHRWNRLVETTQVSHFDCTAGTSGSVQVQADGEWLGRTPMSVSLIPNGLRLLCPPGR